MKSLSERASGRAGDSENNRSLTQSPDHSIPIPLSIVLPVGLRYDGVQEFPNGVRFHQFTELDQTRPSYRASFYVDLDLIAHDCIVQKRLSKECEFARGEKNRPQISQISGAPIPEKKNRWKSGPRESVENQIP